MIIDCSQCEGYQSSHCQDCFVMAVLTRPKDRPLEIDAGQEPAIALLQEAGLAPVLRFRKKAG
ncbi:MAG TPA: hypothetical protein VHJ78_12985 [Actinomycetota bacterium]|nr:hypothetical protein [Actinomycetota bacterium]